MKKRLVAVVLMLTVLLTPMAGYNLAYAKEDDVAETQQVEQAVEEIIEDLEDLMRELEDQKDIVDEQEVADDDLEKAIQEIEQLEAPEAEPVARVAGLQAQSGIPGRIEDGFRRARHIVDIINKQIELKYQFVTNAGDTYRLTTEINQNLNQIRQELKDIVKTPDREFTGEQFDQIKAINRELKEDVGAVDYTAGQMTREMKRYIGFVRGRQFADAVGAFENMVYTQQRQIEILELILNNTEQLLECLYAV